MITPLLLLAAAQTAPQVNIPPPVYKATTVTPLAAAEVFTVEVEVRAGRELLWSGPLRVGGSYPQTSVRREQNEPGGLGCAPTDNPATVSTALYLSLAHRRPGSVLVNVRWTRPGEQPCGPGPNSRAVELSGGANLFPGGAATLTGDGGLSVRLRRR